MHGKEKEAERTENKHTGRTRRERPFSPRSVGRSRGAHTLKVAIFKTTRKCSQGSVLTSLLLKTMVQRHRSKHESKEKLKDIYVGNAEDTDCSVPHKCC